MQELTELIGQEGAKGAKGAYDGSVVEEVVEAPVS